MNKIPGLRPAHKAILCALAIATIGMMIFCGMPPAQASEADARPGNCAACHADGKQALPQTHPDAKAMTPQQCTACHGQDKIPLADKFLADHEQMFSGIWTAPKAPDASGKDAGEKKPSSAVSRKPIPAKTTESVPSCTTCHAKPEYGKIFSRTKHGVLTCSVCHKGVTDIPRHMQGRDAVETSSCLACHQDLQKQGFHANVKKFSCLQCHSGIHPREAQAPEKTRAADGSAASAPAPVIAECIACHSGAGYEKLFARSAHGDLSCAACHQGITDLAGHLKKQEKPGLASCASCHRDIGKTYAESYHAKRANLSCLACHADIHEAVKGKNDKTAGIATCLKCHGDKDRYVNKGHTARVLAGNTDSASCSDCHGTHDMKVFASTDKGSADKRDYYTGLCISCHREGGAAKSYGVFPRAVASYGETYHGKAMKLGEPGKVAGCADCHLAHNILQPGDPASSLNPQTLVTTCGKCHENFHPRFVSYVPHPDPDEPGNFLGLYLTEKFMIALLVGVFGFFWMHSLLWWRKAYAEKSLLVRAGLQVKAELSEEEGRQYVRRFGLKERVMHVVLILSFFSVVISGFPLKYAGAPWARPFISLMGGVENAGNIHRIGAAAMCLLFLYVCRLSVKFLFPGFKFKGWVGRLFGPDSLFPRIKDVKDCMGMFRWFFNRGEKPQFDRWTYWEKFDFLAVFWGMFVIGLSGVVMWIPELSSYVMPGWMINIIHLAHSEEAFLAAVFIFTIHFFNNHLVPDKFPLERNIFTGSYTLEALKKERPLEYARILDENRLEEIRCTGPGTGIQLFAGVFGIASVLVGLALTALIFWAVFMA